MVTLTISPPGPGVPGSSVTVVLTSVLSKVSFSNFHASAPLTESIAATTGALAPTYTLSGAVTVIEPVVLLAGTTTTVLPSLRVKYSVEWLLSGKPSLLVSVTV
ncbi:hypothetical protein D3C71_1715760 [compost metagenome]